MDQNLLSFETLDRTSPDLWPERIPGVSEFVPTSPVVNSKPQQGGPSDKLDKDDFKMLEALGSLTSSQLLEKVKDLQNLAYQLGTEEARQMTRGKFLNILSRPKKS